MKIRIEEKDILNLPNNMELGEYVRKIYLEQKAKAENKKKENCECENCTCKS